MAYSRSAGLHGHTTPQIYLIGVLILMVLVTGGGQNSPEEFVQEMESGSLTGDRIQQIIDFEKDRKEELTPAYAALIEEVFEYYLARHSPKEALQLVNRLANFYIFGAEVNHTKARELLDRMDPFLGDLPLSNELLTFHELNGELELYHSRSREAIKHFREIIRIGNEMGDTTSTSFAYAHLKLGEINSSLWNLMEAVNYFNEASQLFLNLRDSTMFLWCQSGLASLYGNNGLFNEADRARSVIFEKGPGLELYQIVAVAHTSAAIENEFLDNDQEKMFHLRKAEVYSRNESEVQTYIRSIILMLLTNGFSKNHQIDSTQHYFAEFEKLYNADNHGDWIENYFNVAEASYAYALNQYPKAESIIKKLIQGTRSNDNLSMRIRLYELLVRIYKGWDQKERGFNAVESYQVLRDSLEKIGISNRFIYYNQLFESEKKDKEIVRQQASIRLLSEKNKVLFFRLLSIILLLSGVFIILYLRRSRNFARQTSRLRESYSHRLISRQEEERKKIAMDLHDGISQQLIFIKNELDREQKPEISKWVAGSLEDLRQISRSLHPDILKSFGLFLAVDQLVERLRTTTSLKVHKDIEEIDYPMNEETELHLYRMIQEMINNVIRHAQASQIWIRIQEFQDHIRFEVKDNGVGLRPDLINGTSTGIGLNSIRDRSKMIGCKLEINTESGIGTQFILKYFKNENHENSHS